MCRGLGIETVAEYVENPSLRTIVDGLGIDYAQGFSIGRPEPWLQDAPQVPPGLM
jgi:EAL domain-containing protein (putative c-di-GMP-specific phosphodiesterase class I)